MGGKNSVPHENDHSTNECHDRKIDDNGLCQICHYLERHLSWIPVEEGSDIKPSVSAETSERQIETIKREYWVPVDENLDYWGHALSKVTCVNLLRCSFCGNFIIGLWDVAYSCQGCAIICHSICVVNINKSCHEIQSLIEDRKYGVDFQGHTLKRKFWVFQRCAKCKNFVITFIDKGLQCNDCKAVLHESCIYLLDRICPSLYFSQGYKMVSEAASLSSQGFKCPDCNAPIFDESKDCQYCYFTKKFFCHVCHRDKKAIIPEKVLQQWCFCSYPVSNWSQIYLVYMSQQPIIEVSDLANRVTSLNREIFTIIMLFEDIKQYYDYLPECRNDFDRILKPIRKKWPNLLQTPLQFSLSNLQEIFTSFQIDERNDYGLYPQLLKCHEKLVQHVRRDCRKCALHAQKCMVCDYKSSETTPENAIFYFEKTVSNCKNKKCTPLNCVHRNCLRNNPLLTCKGCDTRMMTDEELSSICINFKKSPRVVRAKETTAHNGPNKGTEFSIHPESLRTRTDVQIDTEEFFDQEEAQFQLHERQIRRRRMNLNESHV